MLIAQCCSLSCVLSSELWEKQRLFCTKIQQPPAMSHQYYTRYSCRTSKHPVFSIRSNTKLARSKKKRNTFQLLQFSKIKNCIILHFTVNSFSVLQLCWVMEEVITTTRVDWTDWLTDGLNLESKLPPTWRF